jgi:hypothetical protein
MNNYIFITNEGVTYQPNNTSLEADIENCQVIGFSKGNNEEDAFKNLKKDNKFLLNTNFNEIICMELKNEDCYQKAKYFNLGEEE